MSDACSLCGVIGDRLTVDRLDGESPPAATSSLVRVAVETETQGYPDTLERCPQCGAHFLGELVIDNDMFQPRHELRWTRLTDAALAAWLAAQRR